MNKGERCDREALETAVVSAVGGQMPQGWVWQLDPALDALLPVVDAIARRRAAEELQAAAEAIDADERVSEARNLGQAQRAVGEARSVVLELADALEAK